MSPDKIFQIANSLAMIGWILLIVLPWYVSDKVIIGVVVTLFCVLYAWLIFSVFDYRDFAKFGSLEGVSSLFQNPVMLLAGWVHYLAFDLMAGVFIRRNAIKYIIPFWIIIPILLITFMLGPVGLLLYLLVRIPFTRRYFADNY